MESDQGNGLHKRSQVMVDDAQTVPREKVGEASGTWTIRDAMLCRRHHL